MGTVLKSEYKWQWNINLHRFLVFNSLHFYIILDQLIHISDNCTSLNVHQHKGRYNVAKEKKSIWSQGTFHFYQIFWYHLVYKDQKLCLLSDTLRYQVTDVIWLWKQAHLAQFGYGKHLILPLCCSSISGLFGRAMGTLTWPHLSKMQTMALPNLPEMPPKHIKKVWYSLRLVWVYLCSGLKAPVAEPGLM